MTAIFQTGQPQEITDVLENRDARVALQQQLLTRYPDETLLAIKLNIPGPIKNNQQIKRLFTAGMQRFYDQLGAQTRHFHTLTQWDKPTGNELFITVELDPTAAKQLAVDFEDHDHLGRLFDVDVLRAGRERALSRSDFNLPVRKCLICNREAKDCARSRRHSVTELQARISEIYTTEFEPTGGR
ncbi:citrate lyase holo-[acyl-carrier protein] synthase [Lactobacillus sp. LC28-10]|uniref:citrate lyase holo-[acyl-carrier protein] synthase n=1 Tax=Secundilactobacillus angelensis TaxID=2722706 RepID=A0ABX1KX02_9LACO|nr:citrate lyase holo-[acyl-carrier protein] synthase [Secundilactobacillus angelensis]MCH5462379.1 citrate lyase holo-[acyl-carrier protein] synthase [Secundilactobacillus angelensis]NLR18139.1 citrate lyase holo-[acyl-carrier protein] synthase [Secundilactobacillus angelensis]